MRRFLAVAAVALLALSGCASGNDDQPPATVTETVTSSSTSSTNSSTEETTTLAEAAASTEAADDCLVGSMGQPQFSGTTCLNKTVASCGDPGMHETGTTFFTDGTSGWTQTCADQMTAAPRPHQNQVVVCPDGSTAESHYDCPVETAPEQNYQPPAAEQPVPADPGQGAPAMPGDAGQGTGGY